MRREFDAVDDIAEIARQLLAALRLGGRGARLGKLPGDATDLDHRLLAGEGQHHRHLQQHAEGVANIVRVELGEALRAVATLEQKTAPLRDVGEVGFQGTGFAGKDQRRELGKRRLDLAELGGIAICRQMLRFVRFPAFGCPVTRHVTNSVGPDLVRHGSDTRGAP
jgi:hypothetical protein